MILSRLYHQLLKSLLLPQELTVFVFMCNLGTNSRLSTAAPLKILNIQMFQSEISPSPPDPSSTFSRTYAFDESSLVLTSPVTPRAERDIPLRGNGREEREEKQGCPE